MRKLWITAILLIAFLFTFIACASPATSPSLPAQLTNPSQEVSAPKSNEWKGQVNRAWVVAHSHNWGADAEDDGLRVWVELQDNDENMIEYTKVNIPVEIKIYSTESKTYPLKPARVIYTNSSSLANWDNDAFVTGAKGIMDINWEEISPALPSEQQEYGIIYVDIVLPNSNHFSASYDETRIKK
ncbi:MAG: hypothetical protein PHR43_06845 [Dehalococcoidales bacterium]|nr:hypothetical protein [Dehalococcoidales bacterium]